MHPNYAKAGWAHYICILLMLYFELIKFSLNRKKGAVTASLALLAGPKRKYLCILSLVPCDSTRTMNLVCWSATCEATAKAVPGNLIFRFQPRCYGVPSDIVVDPMKIVSGARPAVVILINGGISAWELSAMPELDMCWLFGGSGNLLRRCRLAAADLGSGDNPRSMRHKDAGSGFRGGPLHRLRKPTDDGAF